VDLTEAQAGTVKKDGEDGSDGQEGKEKKMSVKKSIGM